MIAKERHPIRRPATPFAVQPPQNGDTCSLERTLAELNQIAQAMCVGRAGYSPHQVHAPANDARYVSRD